jgi:hypothetical protein
VRTDIPLEQQLVQAAHAALELGLSYKRPRDIISLIALQIPDKQALTDAAERAEAHYIRIERFYEPDDDLGFTAFATQPLTKEESKPFRNYKLWRPQ